MKKLNELKSRCIFCRSLIRLSKLQRHKKHCLKAYLKSDKVVLLRARNIAAKEEAEKQVSNVRKLHPLIAMFKHGFSQQHEANYGAH